MTFVFVGLRNTARNQFFWAFLPLLGIFSMRVLQSLGSTSRAASSGGVVRFSEARFMRFSILRRGAMLVHLWLLLSRFGAKTPLAYFDYRF